MIKIQWNHDKNERLKKERGVSFEEVVVLIENRQVLAIEENPSNKYKNQEMFIVKLHNCICYVPFIRNKDSIFLKTIIPSRRLNNGYEKEGKKDAKI